MTHQNPTNHRNLQRSGRNPEDNSLQYEGDALGASINRSRQSACLPTQMELQIEVEQMLKCIPRDFSYGALSDIRKYGVKKFTREGSPDPRCAVCCWMACRCRISGRRRRRDKSGMP